MLMRAGRIEFNGDWSPVCRIRSHHATVAAVCRSGEGDSAALCDGVAGISLGGNADVARSHCGRYLAAVAGRPVALRSGQPVSLTDLLLRVATDGVQPALASLDGAFVLALWDQKEKGLSLARDPAGQRSLYYGWVHDTFVFATSLDRLRLHPGFEPEVDGGALALFLRHGYVPAPHCIYRGVFKLDAGRVVTLDQAAVMRGAAMHQPGIDQRRWWAVGEAYAEALEQREALPVAAALDALDMHMHRAVDTATAGAQRTGAFLSGGTDSSLMAALLQAQSDQAVDTLGVGFDDPAHDERQWMEAVAARLGVRHHTVVFDEEDVVDHVMRIPQAWGEPFADASQIPTLMASEVLATHCSLALTGDGGDELFCGHGAYERAIRNDRLCGWVPGWMRSGLARLDDRDPEAWRNGGMHALVAEASGTGIAHHYLMRVSRWRAPSRLLPGVIEPLTIYRDGPVDLPGGDAADAVQYLDFAMELSNGILCKVEGAASWAGLSAVAPMLDRRVTAFAWQLPTALKRHGGEQKWILKQLLCRYLPESLVRRPKRGFGPPIATWLRGPLRGWAEGLLAPCRMQAAGLHGTAHVVAMWQRFLSGERRWHPHLWTVLMYLQWFEHNRCRPPRLS